MGLHGVLLVSTIATSRADDFGALSPLAGLVPASTAVPAAIAEQKENQNYDEKRRGICGSPPNALGERTRLCLKGLSDFSAA